jgi:hypothetical protein
MLDLGLHIFGFLSFIDLFLFDVIIIDSLFGVVPVIFILLLSLLPGPCCVFIFIINIFHVLDFIGRLAELRPRKDFC